MNKVGIIIHIPHSSNNIPEFFYPCFYDLEKMQDNLLVMTDWYTDELFDCGFNDSIESIVHQYSRLICDVERFLNPLDESMFAKGMGMYYTHSYDNTLLKKSPFVDLEGLSYYSLVLQIYQKHHQLFLEKVNSFLEKYDNVIIVDAHSFSNEILPFEDVSSLERPDICIGTDYIYTSETLKNFSKEFFNKLGLSVEFDYPYSGTIVPAFYLKDENCNNHLYSIMIEINKELYLQNNTNVKSFDFYRIKSMINEFLYNLLNFNFDKSINCFDNADSNQKQLSKPDDNFSGYFKEIKDINYIMENLNVNSIINHVDYGRGTVTDVFHKMDDKNKFTITFDKNPYAPQTFYYDAIKQGKFSLVVRK